MSNSKYVKYMAQKEKFQELENLKLKLDGLRGKKENGEELTDEEETMLHEYAIVVLQLETMRPLLEAFEEEGMPSSDLGKRAEEYESLLCDYPHCRSRVIGSRLVAQSISQPLKTAEEEETDTEDLIFEITSLNTRMKIKKEKKEKKEKKAQVMKARSKSSKVVKGSVIINEDEIAELVKVSSLKQDLQKGLDQLKSDYVKHLSLRSASGSIENLKIDHEGETYTLQEIAQIGKKGSQLLVVNLSGFPTLMRDVLKAINDSGMGLNPQQDGTTIFIPIPKVTREYRENLAKNAKTMFQKFKDHSRDIQNRYIRDVKKKEKEVSSDLSHSVQQQIQTMTEQYVVEGEKVMIAKQNELLGKE
ncbi:ribosome-recycling factor, mitochondrial-like isoform X2 [Daphnia pulicaria]|uniref:ribosome-recycling factor, mitochondrial-like isoform X2 n=1 Tax=Daphnia pulicaria TaxID=35523 RepID=UPI001EEC2302|nr:ribosome-recycling factor, mitochondrial-like isoform X2 [Daphnia pulicaria]XP_046657658.1 ribosome-recycling factor, mitochondrial-like isoform X2 [Daphnia pulicaria]